MTPRRVHGAEPSRARPGRGWLALAGTLALTVAAGLIVASEASAKPPIEGWWTKPRVAVKNVGRNTRPRIRRGPGRYAVIVWRGKRGGKQINLMSVRELGERDFGKPRRVGEKGQKSGIGLKMGLAGDTLLHWRDEETGTVSVSTRTPREDWSEPLVLTESEDVVTGTWARVAPDGGMIVVWKARNDDGSTRLEATLRPPGGEWGEPFTAIEDMGFTDAFFDIVLGNGMNGAVVWRDDCFPANPDLVFDSKSVVIEGGEFGEVERIPNSACPHTYFSLAIDDTGRTLATVDGFGGVDFLVKLAVREPGASFGAAERLGPEGEEAFGSAALMTPDGKTAVVWGRLRNEANGGVRAALGDSDGLGPARVISGGTSGPATHPSRRPAINAAGDVAVLVDRPLPRPRLAAAYRDGRRDAFRRPEFVTGPVQTHAQRRALFDSALSMGPGGQPSVVWLAVNEKRSPRKFWFMLAERRSTRR